MAIADPVRREDRPGKTRAANDRVALRAHQLRFLSRVPMRCECEQVDCDTLILVPLDCYREVRRDPSLFLTMPGHALSGATLVRAELGYEIHGRLATH